MRLPWPTIKRTLMELLGIFFGNFISVCGLNILVIPYHLLSGGVTGIALIGQYLIKIPVFYGILALNVPIFLWGLKELKARTMFYSLFGIISMSVLLPLTKPYLPTPKVDLLLAAIFGGVLGGIGGGIVFRSNGTAGGTDIIALILKKKLGLSLGEVGFYSNLLVIVISMFFFNLEIALYTLISMYVSGKICDQVVDGLKLNKSITIISNQSQLIADRILSELNRGVTFLSGEGAYSKERKQVINCVVSHFELVKVKEIVQEADANAFMYVTESKEVLGKGFRLLGGKPVPLQKEVGQKLPE